MALSHSVVICQAVLMLLLSCGPDTAKNPLDLPPCPHGTFVDQGGYCASWEASDPLLHRRNYTLAPMGDWLAAVGGMELGTGPSTSVLLLPLDTEGSARSRLLAVARVEPAVVPVANRGLLLLGGDAGSGPHTWELVYPEHQRHRMQHGLMPHRGLHWGGAAMPDGDVLAGLPWDEAAEQRTSLIWRFDLKHQTFRRRSDLPRSLVHAAWLPHEEGAMVVGSDASHAVHAYIYVESLDVWRTMDPPTGSARVIQAIRLRDGSVFVLGQRDLDRAVAWRWFPTRGSWDAVPMPEEMRWAFPGPVASLPATGTPMVLLFHGRTPYAWSPPDTWIEWSPTLAGVNSVVFAGGRVYLADALAGLVRFDAGATSPSFRLPGKANFERTHLSGRDGSEVALLIEPRDRAGGLRWRFARTGKWWKGIPSTEERSESIEMRVPLGGHDRATVGLPERHWLAIDDNDNFYVIDHLRQDTIVVPRPEGMDAIQLTELRDGRVLATGSSKPQLLARQPMRWMSAGFPGDGPAGHSARRLSNGRTLVMGGGEDGRDTWWYEPPARWIRGPKAAIAAERHVLGELGDGSVVAFANSGRVQVLNPEQSEWTESLRAPVSAGSRPLTVRPSGDGGLWIWGRGGSATYRRHGVARSIAWGPNARRTWQEGRGRARCLAKGGTNQCPSAPHPKPARERVPLLARPIEPDRTKVLNLLVGHRSSKQGAPTVAATARLRATLECNHLEGDAWWDFPTGRHAHYPLSAGTPRTVESLHAAWLQDAVCAGASALNQAMQHSTSKETALQAWRPPYQHKGPPGTIDVHPSEPAEDGTRQQLEFVATWESYGRQTTGVGESLVSVVLGRAILDGEPKRLVALSLSVTEEYAWTSQTLSNITEITLE